mmetsp:Transcript_3229/g.12039  ORF Transcript_3229/g.12039 Transcript_3229/m.12039 type:complete len:658 (-) Transcript_3229:293-2266(-)
MSSKRRRGNAEDSKQAVVIPVAVEDERDEEDAEPEELMCPITRTMFRDPALVVDSGQTYERRAIRSHFRQARASAPRSTPVMDPVTRTPLYSTRTVVNWVARRCVEAWLQRHPGRIPEGWDGSRELGPAGGFKGVRPEDLDALNTLTWTMDASQVHRWPSKGCARQQDESQWVGVTFEDGRVMELDLEKGDVTGAVPKVIGAFTAMETLDLMSNEITSIPKEIGACVSLRRLVLTGNSLKTLPKAIGQLASLKTLLISENELKTLPAEIGNLTQLEELDASWNKMITVPGSIGRITDTLKALNLQGNRLTFLPKELGNLASLEFLNLADNDIRDIPREFGELQSIDEMDLSNNALLRSLPESVLLLKWEGASIFIDESCDIGCHPNDFEVLAALRNHWPPLKRLWVDSKPPMKWKGVTISRGDVSKLNLKKMKLTGGVPPVIGKLQCATSIDFSGNDLTSLPSELGNLFSLEELRLKDNPKLKKIPGILGRMDVQIEQDKGVRFQMPRFKVGTRVECNVRLQSGKSRWLKGQVLQHYWRDYSWPKGQFAPYQVELDESIPGSPPTPSNAKATKIFAPADNDYCIRSMATAAKMRKRDTGHQNVQSGDPEPQEAIPVANAHSYAAEPRERQSDSESADEPVLPPTMPFGIFLNRITFP